jgi:regulator of sirC expression with transglutaminase-like and TPR domain
MPGSLHFQAPTTLEYFASLVAEDAGLPLLEAAASIAQDEHPQLDTQAVLADVDALAHRLRRRIPADAVAVQRLRWLNRYFFQELGFGGNANDYYDPGNSYLHRVLETRRGIPITLALLFVELATQIGLTAHGVSFPGHFLVKLRMSQGEIVIDPFTGQSLSRDALEEMLLPYTRGSTGAGRFQAPLGLFLQAAPAREVLARMLRNLKEIHRSAEDWPRLLAVTQRLVVLLPAAWAERRDRGLAYAALGCEEAAAADLTAYLERAGEITDRDAVAARLTLLARGRSPRLH